MRTIILIILFSVVLSCKTDKQDLDQTIDYLEYAIENNPPFNSIKAELKYIEKSKDSSQNKYGSGFLYNFILVDNKGKRINSKLDRVYIDEMKNFILEKTKYDGNNTYTLRIGLKNHTTPKSFTTVLGNGIDSKNIDEVNIILPPNEELANKVKKAIIRLAEIEGVKLKELDDF